MKKLGKSLSDHKTGIKFLRIIFILLIASIVWVFMPVPSGLSERGFHMLIIFVSTMVGMMLEVFPMCGFLFISLLIASLTKTIDLKTQGFSGFTNTVPWLLFFVLALSKAVTSSTLGLRIAYFFLKIFGKNILGLAYSISLTETFLSTILPSNTARSASIGFPLVTSLSGYIGSHVKNASIKAVGSFLTLVYTTANSICSNMFLTAMISNAIIFDYMEKHDVSVNWITWAKNMIIPGIILLFIIPLVLYFLVPPKVNNLGELQKVAHDKSKEMGPLTKNEKYVIIVFGSMLVLWILADIIGINIMTTTLLGLCVFLMIGTFSIKDVLSDHSALNSVITLGILISYVNNLTDFGVIQWFNHSISHIIQYTPSSMHVYILCIVYFFTHYFFSGEGSRIIALYLPFLTTGLALGIDKIQLMTLLTAFSSLSDMLAHYTCPVSILMFTNNYISVKKWMSVGIVLSIISMSVWFLYSSFALMFR